MADDDLEGAGRMQDVPPPRRAPDRALPPYRYRPGEGPHPRKHPDGHSRDRIPSPASDPEFALDLFNRRYFWEAHEVWEDLWRDAPRDSAAKMAYQGLIQAAAALLKDDLGHVAAANRLAAAACARIARAVEGSGGPRVLGLDLEGFAARFVRYRAAPGTAPFPYLVP